MSDSLNVVEIEYPESDGEPLGETDHHRHWIFRIIELLKHRYRNEQVYVTGDLMFYYRQARPRFVICPDVFLVKNHHGGFRRVYKLWEEGKPPNVVFEITSVSTARSDQTKFDKYQEIGVQEVWLFDPTADVFDPPLQGHVLRENGYDDIAADSQGHLRSEELSADLRLTEDGLEFIDATSGDIWQTPEEAALSAADSERARATAERARAAEERANTQAERSRADAERDRADRLEAELRALRTSHGSGDR